MTYDIEKQANEVNADFDVRPSAGLTPGKLTHSETLPAKSASRSDSSGSREPFGSRIGNPQAPLQAKGSKSSAPAAPKAAQAPPPNLEELAGAIGAAYQFLFEKQANGINNLKEKGAKSDEKEGDFFLSFLEVAASLAVTAAPQSQ